MSRQFKPRNGYKKKSYVTPRKSLAQKAIIASKSRKKSMMINIEKKFFDTALSFSVDTTLGCATDAATGLLNLIAQGDTESTRDGRVCNIKSIQIRGVLAQNPGAAASSSPNVHIWLILDSQCNGEVPTITTFFSGTNAATAMLNLANSNRFRIIKHWIFNIEPKAGATTAYNITRVPWEYYKKCDIPIHFSSTTGAIGEVKSNNLFLAYGVDNAVDDDTTGVTATCRLRFES